MNNDTTFDASETDRLYHYTTQDGLLGILENNCLWATHYKFLNDFSELGLFKKELVKLIEPDVRESLEKAYSDFLKETDPYTDEQKIVLAQNLAKNHCFERTNEIIDQLYEHIAKNYEIYITSLCESHSKPIKSNILHGLFRQSDIYDGLLSQWRAYGGDGGYAIEFQRNNITERINKERSRFTNYEIIFGDVIYNDDENEYKQHFSKELDLIKTYIKDEIEPSQTERDRKKVYEALIRCTAFYKDCGFKEEREFRIVALLSVPLLTRWCKDDYKNDKPREFRDKNGEQVPYIELFKNKTDISKNTYLLINKIIVGPHKDKEARAAWLRIKLDSMGRDDIEVAVSQIPFVGR